MVRALSRIGSFAMAMKKISTKRRGAEVAAESAEIFGFGTE
jgi:hypothetical protein